MFNVLDLVCGWLTKQNLRIFHRGMLRRFQNDWGFSWGIVRVSISVGVCRRSICSLFHVGCRYANAKLFDWIPNKANDTCIVHSSALLCHCERNFCTFCRTDQLCTQQCGTFGRKASKNLAYTISEHSQTALLEIYVFTSRLPRTCNIQTLWILVFTL